MQKIIKIFSVLLLLCIGSNTLQAQNYICPGESYTLTAQAGLTNYQWYTISAVPDTVAISGATSQTYTATAAGKYIYKAKDANLCTVTLCTPLVITTNPCCKPNAGVDQTTCWGTTVTLTGTTPTTGTWSAQAGNPAGANVSTTTAGVASVTFSGTASGSYYFIYNIGGTCNDTMMVTVNTAVADAGLDKILNCTTTSTTIGTLAIVGNTYSWLPATGLSATNVAQPTANPSVTTTYTVTATGSNGCTATDVVTVNVNTTAPTVDAGMDKTISCATPSTSIGTAAIVGNSYSWSPSTGLSATNVAEPTANPLGTTTYTVTVTGTNGCTATDMVVVTYDSAKGTIGNYVWFDFNHNGLNDEAANNGINGITVELYKETTPGNYVLDQSTTTAVNGGNPGYYQFEVCASGNYKVKFPLTNGVNALTLQTNTAATDNNSDAGMTTGFTDVFAIDIYGTGNAKDNMTIDAGYQFVCPTPNCGTGTIIKN